MANKLKHCANGQVDLEFKKLAHSSQTAWPTAKGSHVVCIARA